MYTRDIINPDTQITTRYFCSSATDWVAEIVYSLDIRSPLITKWNETKNTIGAS